MELLVKGFWAHSYPVECLGEMDGLLASGALEEVRIWKRVGTGAPWYIAPRVTIDHNPVLEWAQEAELQLPPRTSYNRLLPVVVTSVHWVRADSGEDAHLMVTYLNHGVQ